MSKEDKINIKNTHPNAKQVLPTLNAQNKINERKVDPPHKPLRPLPPLPLKNQETTVNPIQTIAPSTSSIPSKGKEPEINAEVSENTNTKILNRKRSNSLPLPSKSNMFPLEEKKLNTRWERFKNYIQNSQGGKGFKKLTDWTATTKFGKKFLEIKDKAVGKLEAFKKTRIGKLIEIAMGTAVGRALTITLAALTIAGLTTPVAPAVAAAIGALAITAVAVGAAMDVNDVRSMRRLEKEHNLLIKHRSAKSRQALIHERNPKLKEILKDQLIIPEDKDINAKKLASKNADKLIYPKAIGKTILRNAPDVAADVTEAVATGGFSTLRKIGSYLYTLVSDTQRIADIDNLRLRYKQEIDLERSQPDTPDYKGLNELSQKTRQQNIQTKTLQELSNDVNFDKMTDAEIKSKFSEIKVKIEQNEPVVNPKGNLLSRGLHFIGSVAKDTARAHNPFSIYNTPENIEVKEHSDLSKGYRHINKLKEGERISSEKGDAPLSPSDKKVLAKGKEIFEHNANSPNERNKLEKYRPGEIPKRKKNLPFKNNGNSLE